MPGQHLSAFCYEKDTFKVDCKWKNISFTAFPTSLVSLTLAGESLTVMRKGAFCNRLHIFRKGLKLSASNMNVFEKKTAPWAGEAAQWRECLHCCTPDLGSCSGTNQDTLGQRRKL